MIAAIRGKTPDIHHTVFVAGNATVIGDVSLRAGASVWFGAVVRGDSNGIRIGEQTNVQDLCVLHVDHRHPLTLGNDVTVGHRAILHGCTISDRVLVGMGATVMNGAVIGSDVIVGAGALVTEGADIPPRSLVLGVPGRVKRDLTDEEVAGIKTSAEHYAEYAGWYLDAAATS